MAASTSLSPSALSVTQPTTHSDRLLAMLCYHPLLDFEPSPAPSQRTAIMLHDPEAFAVSQQVQSDNAEVVTRSFHDGKNTLESLLEFARCNNERERATLSLDNFLRQLQDERAEVEEKLEAQSAVAAENFVLGLVDTKLGAEVQIRERRPSNDPEMSSGLSQIEAVSTVPIVPKEMHQGWVLSPTPSTKRFVAFQIRERLRTLQPGDETPAYKPMHENVTKIRREIQRGYETFAGSPDRTEQVFTMELVLRHLLQSPQPTQPERVFLRRTLRARLQLIRDEVNARLTLGAKGGLTDLIERELRGIATSAKTGKLYSIEVLLHPCEERPAIPQSRSNFQVAAHERGDGEVITQQCPASHTTRASYVNAAVQTLPESVKMVGLKLQSPRRQAPTLSTSDSSTALLDHLAMGEPSQRSQSPNPTTLDSPTASLDKPILDNNRAIVPSNSASGVIQPVDKLLLSVAETCRTGEPKAKNGIPDAKEESANVPVKETVKRLMARKKERQANNGPDAFLSLLDLVRVTKK